jgi:uracil-DNA glycosylase
MPAFLYYREGNLWRPINPGTLERGTSMQVKGRIGCAEFPCLDVRHEGYVVPEVEIDPQGISILMISEAAPAERKDYYYAGGDSAFERTTLEAFKEAGAEVSSFKELMAIGVYLTSAVKCGKTGYGIKAGTIKECSRLLEGELALFPNIKVIMLMGDVAIKAINYIAKRAGAARVIAAGSTYKIRGQEYYFRGMRAFPSYLQAGPSFGIEKSKRRMIAEDISAALSLMS